MRITQNLQDALVSLVSRVEAAIEVKLFNDDGSTEKVRQFLFDCEVDEEKFEAFPRLSAAEIEDEIGDQIHELRRDETDEADRDYL